MTESSENPKKELERFPVAELTSDEISAVKGVRYADLPDQFFINEKFLDACRKVSRSKPIVKVTASEATRRAVDYYSQKSEEDPYHKDHIKAARQVGQEFDNGVVEFSQKFYLLNQEVVIGEIHQGQFNQIRFPKDQDGIPDKRCVLNIHKHPSDLPQSVGDFAHILAEDEKVPSKCMYFAVGPNAIFLLFPTEDSPRIDLDVLRERAKESKFTTDEAHLETVKSLASEYKLGYYSSNYSTALRRVI